MSNTIEGFGKWICDLIGSVATMEDDASILNTLANKVILDVNMLCPFIDGCIVGKVFCTVIVHSDQDRLFRVGWIKRGTKS